MNALTSLTKRHALVIFCALTIALTFSFPRLPLPAEVAPVVMVSIPALTALALTASAEGKAGLRSLLGKLTHWQISPKWVVIALMLAFQMRFSISLPASGLGLMFAI